MRAGLAVACRNQPTTCLGELRNIPLVDFDKSLDCSPSSESSSSALTTGSVDTVQLADLAGNMPRAVVGMHRLAVAVGMASSSWRVPCTFAAAAAVASIEVESGDHSEPCLVVSSWPRTRHNSPEAESGSIGSGPDSGPASIAS